MAASCSRKRWLSGCAFLIIFSSVIASEISLAPSDVIVVALGGDITFSCSSLTDEISDVQWHLDSPLNTFEDDVATIIFVAHVHISLLQLTDLPMRYNGTKVQCMANFTAGTGEFVSNATTLLIQDLLGVVSSISLTVKNSTITLNWLSPFSLDIYNVDPDITYCVNVLNSTTHTVVDSQCGITETEYEYPVPPDAICHIYLFTVTPINVVGNGTTNFFSYFATRQRPEVLELVQVASLTFDYSIYLLQISAPVCSSELSFTDLGTHEMITLRGADLTIAEDNITFSSELLSLNHNYNFSVSVKNIAGSTSTIFRFSTHDIMNATATLNAANDVEVTTLYSEHSDARGALFDFVFIDDNGDVNFTRSVLLTLDRNTSLHHTLPFNLYPGQYRVFVYDIESDGTLSNGVGYPAVEITLLCGNNRREKINFLRIARCYITTFSTTITAVCSNISFQMIAQLSDSSEVHKLHINKSIDLQTPVIVQVEESGTYQVTIFSIEEGTGTLDSTVGYMQQVFIINTSYAIPITREMLATISSPLSQEVSTSSQETLILIISAPVVAILIIILTLLVYKMMSLYIRLYIRCSSKGDATLRVEAAIESDAIATSRAETVIESRVQAVIEPDDAIVINIATAVIEPEDAIVINIATASEAVIEPDASRVEATIEPDATSKVEAFIEPDAKVEAVIEPDAKVEAVIEPDATSKTEAVIEPDATLKLEAAAFGTSIEESGIKVSIGSDDVVFVCEHVSTSAYMKSIRRLVDADMQSSNVMSTRTLSKVKVSNVEIQSVAVPDKTLIWVCGSVELAVQEKGVKGKAEPVFANVTNWLVEDTPVFPNVTNWLLEDTDIKKSIVTHSKEKSNSINQGSLVCEEIGDIEPRASSDEYYYLVAQSET